MIKGIVMISLLNHLKGQPTWNVIKEVGAGTEMPATCLKLRYSGA